jgi:hypothetical protein
MDEWPVWHRMPHGGKGQRNSTRRGKNRCARTVPLTAIGGEGSMNGSVVVKPVGMIAADEQDRNVSSGAASACQQKTTNTSTQAGQENNAPHAGTATNTCMQDMGDNNGRERQQPHSGTTTQQKDCTELQATRSKNTHMEQRRPCAASTPSGSAAGTSSGPGK